jgi:hypothetical protein
MNTSVFAAMLGTLKMGVDEAIESYRSNFMFEETKEPKESRMKKALGLRGRPSSQSSAVRAAQLFDGEAFEQHITRIIQARRDNTRQTSTACHTVITSSRT